jgi:hypothetical protein
MLRRQLDFTPPPRTPIRLTYSLRILQHQQIIALDELTGLVVVKVLALVGDFAVRGSRRHDPGADWRCARRRWR